MLLVVDKQRFVPGVFTSSTRLVLDPMAAITGAPVRARAVFWHICQTRVLLVLAGRLAEPPALPMLG